MIHQPLTYQSDDAPFALSPSQAENFASWSRPQELFADETEEDDESVMIAKGNCNFVQDVTTDCSVVASLCAALEVLVGKHAVSCTRLHIALTIFNLLTAIIVTGTVFHLLSI